MLVNLVKGISKAKGKYICFLDADDFWNNGKLKDQLNFMKKNNYLISHTSYYIYKDNIKISKRFARNFQNLNSLIFSCDIGCSTVMIKKNVLNKKDNFPELKTKGFCTLVKIVK